MVYGPCQWAMHKCHHGPFGEILLSPVENGGAFRGKMAARGTGGLKGWALGEPGIGIGWGQPFNRLYHVNAGLLAAGIPA